MSAAGEAAAAVSESDGTSPATTSDSLTTTPAKPFWRRITDALGIDSKSDEQPATDPSAGGDSSASASSSATAPAAAAVAAPATAGTSKPTEPQARTAGSPPGPEYRPGRPTQSSPNQSGPAQADGKDASSTTALLPTAAAGGAAAAGAGAEDQASAQQRPAATRRTRKARLRLSRLDPWSVMKTSFLFSIAAGIVLVVAVYAVWVVLSTSGLFSSVNGIVAAVLSSPGDTTPFRVEDYLSTQRVTGAAAVIAVVDVLLFTALATLGSFLYNLAATMLGGLEVTLAED